MILRIDPRAPAPLPEINTIQDSFLPEWLRFARAEKMVRAVVNEELAPEPLRENLWGFDLWYAIKTRYPTIESLYADIRDSKSALERAIDTYRPRIEIAKRFEPLYAAIASLAAEASANGNYFIDSSRLIPIYKGVSGSYFLTDENGRTIGIVKPLDEDCGCLNNPKSYATPFSMSPIRDNMPLYLSSLREALASQIANSANLGNVVPKTVLAVLESDRFSYLIDRISPSEMSRYLAECGPDLKEKLCSVQEFVPNAKTLFEARHDLQMAGLSDEEIANRFDQRDFEDANILIWTTYDTDAHAGNILVYAKGTDAIGNEILGLKKIDNGLAFPDKNRQLHNSLSNLPNARRPLSEEGRAKIAALDPDALSAQLEAYGLSSAVPALRERIAYLKELSQKPDITLHQINQEMSKLGMRK
jgi:hypothetical protein